MTHRLFLTAFVLCASLASRVAAHPGGHGIESVLPPVWDATVEHPAKAWSNLKDHRDGIAKAVESQDLETAARMATELPSVAGDLIRVSTELSEADLESVQSMVRDLMVTARQLAASARAGRGARAADLLLRIDAYMKSIAAKYPQGALES